MRLPSAPRLYWNVYSTFATVPSSVVCQPTILARRGGIARRRMQAASSLRTGDGYGAARVRRADNRAAVPPPKHKSHWSLGRRVGIGGRRELGTIQVGWDIGRRGMGRSLRGGGDRVGINSIGPLPYAKGLSGAARAGRQQSRARGWSWVLVIACRTLVKPRGPGCAGETGRACPAMLESFLSTPLRAACPWTGSGPSRSLWMAAPVPGACTGKYPNPASSEATSVF